MRILYLRSSEMFGSPERMIIGQCLRLSQYHEFICSSFVRRDKTNRFMTECLSNSIEIEPITDSFPGDLRLAYRLKRLIAKHKIDLVVTHDYKSDVYAYLCLMNTGIPHVAYHHGVTSEDLKVRIYNAVDRLVLKRMKQVIAVSAQTKRALVRAGICEHRIVVVPNAVDEDSLMPRNPADSPLSHTKRVVAAGRLSYEKGFDLLIQAVSIAHDKAPQFRLYLYGTGPEEQRLKGLVESLSLGEIVVFCGFTADLLGVFRTMDFVVIPSRSEGMPVILLEAWSQGLGAVATKAGGIADILVHGVNGLMAPVEDVHALSRMLLLALNDVDKMDEYGRNGFTLVKEHYTYSKQAELLLEFYNTI